MLDAIDMISAERTRQINQEGFAVGHDKRHFSGELAMAACYYAIPCQVEVSDKGFRASLYPDVFFPGHWGLDWAKRHSKDRIRQLVVAGALIVAEIDRLLSGSSNDKEDALLLYNATSASIGLIAAEHARQKEEGGYAAWHDKPHADDELAMAVCYYAMPRQIEVFEKGFRASIYPEMFFPVEWDLNGTKRHDKDRIEQLVIAGVFVTAAIDRLLTEKSREEPLCVSYHAPCGEKL